MLYIYIYIYTHTYYVYLFSSTVLQSPIYFNVILGRAPSLQVLPVHGVLQFGHLESPLCWPKAKHLKQMCIQWSHFHLLCIQCSSNDQGGTHKKLLWQSGTVPRRCQSQRGNCHNNWLVVWNMTLIFHDFPISWECRHPNWLIFFRGVCPTTNQP